MAEAYGVWKERMLYGRPIMGIERSTFLIDEEGIVAEVWRKVKPQDTWRCSQSYWALDGPVSAPGDACWKRARCTR